jgi:hypothetical protein
MSSVNGFNLCYLISIRGNDIILIYCRSQALILNELNDKILAFWSRVTIKEKNPKMELMNR